MAINLLYKMLISRFNMNIDISIFNYVTNKTYKETSFE